MERWPCRPIRRQNASRGKFMTRHAVSPLCRIGYGVSEGPRAVWGNSAIKHFAPQGDVKHGGLACRKLPGDPPETICKRSRRLWRRDCALNELAAVKKKRIFLGLYRIGVERRIGSKVYRFSVVRDSKRPYFTVYGNPSQGEHCSCSVRTGFVDVIDTPGNTTQIAVWDAVQRRSIAVFRPTYVSLKQYNPPSRRMKCE